MPYLLEVSFGCVLEEVVREDGVVVVRIESVSEFGHPSICVKHEGANPIEKRQ